jgi:hypothetical protein
VGSQQLSADMGRVMLELQRHQFAARILPRNGLPVDMPAVARTPEESMGSAGNKPAHSPGDAMNETVAQRALAAPPPATAAEPAPAQVTPVPVPEPLPPALIAAAAARTPVWGMSCPAFRRHPQRREEAASHGRERGGKILRL